LKTFADLGLADPLLRAVQAEGYTHPTPIQAEVIPAMIAGHDVIGIAQTGTGKTASFVLPILQKLAARKLSAEKWSGPGPKSFTTLILAPTRELANQICESIRTYGKFMRPSVALVVGGASPVPQIKALSGGLDVVVATPGRLLDHVRSGKARLDKTSVIVLDEADQMLDLGFMPAIEEIMRKISQTRQTLLLSATMPRPIRALAQEFMNQPKEIAVTVEAKPVEKIHQEIIMVDQSQKSELLVDLLAAREVERAIVFTRTKRGTDKVERMLNDAGLRCIGIHGDKTQGQRNKALAQFKSGAMRIMVATDVAARGLDVDDISHVVNFDMPMMPEAYVHRIGRTGRAGKSGIAISLCDRSERNLLRDIERLTNTSLESIKASPEGSSQTGRFTLAPLPAGSARRDDAQRRIHPNPRAGAAKKPFSRKPPGDGRFAAKSSPRPAGKFGAKSSGFSFEKPSGFSLKKPATAKPSSAKPAQKPMAKSAHKSANHPAAKPAAGLGRRPSGYRDNGGFEKTHS